MFDTVTSARALMGLSLAFHIAFATIGIGLPLLLLVAEGIWLRTGNEIYREMAKRWARVAGMLFGRLTSGRLCSAPSARSGRRTTSGSS